MTKAELLRKVVDELKGIKKHVGELSKTYEQNPELNNIICISNIIPMSLDEWALALTVKIEELDKMREDLEK